MQNYMYCVFFFTIPTLAHMDAKSIHTKRSTKISPSCFSTLGRCIFISRFSRVGTLFGYIWLKEKYTQMSDRGTVLYFSLPRIKHSRQSLLKMMIDAS